MEEEKKFEIEVLTRLTKIETLLEDFKGVESKCNEAYNLSKDNEKRLNKIEEKQKELEENKRWLYRTSIGAVITATISAIVGIVVALIK